MKKLLLIIPLLFISFLSIACPACEKQQPKLLKGISHGSGPEGTIDMIIIWSSAVIVLLTLFFSIKWIIKPGEKSPDHIKRLILNQE